MKGLLQFVKQATKKPIVSPIRSLGTTLSSSMNTKQTGMGLRDEMKKKFAKEEKKRFTATIAKNNPSVKQMVAAAGPSKRSPAEIEAIKRRARAADPFTSGRTMDLSHVGKAAQSTFANPRRPVDPETAMFNAERAKRNAQMTDAQKKAHRDLVRKDSLKDNKPKRGKSGM